MVDFHTSQMSDDNIDQLTEQQSIKGLMGMANDKSKRLVQSNQRHSKKKRRSKKRVGFEEEISPGRRAVRPKRSQGGSSVGLASETFTFRDPDAMRQL